ncbi:MarR family winged helix-turn-helix transcriptional regulator [Fictibacillus barbaricus]|uniref:DNA-binding MarR family transcriptional regulator n=1 Tax=Fictibacillus barbaricus TaxID=182136 RepID=A0ABU1TWD6_9BACL|nr:MarR family transcriptional regulator [Fictibacillus barbaricus]MDR7071521.1 DNA-binding MarR family transcriptional regulator [Fictibacillus barbaricus]
MEKNNVDNCILDNCLYFTVNKLSRAITRMAEDSFKKTGLSPTHAFCLMLVNNKPGISQSELAEQLHMMPSTITRFIDKLVMKGLIERKAEGKRSFIFPTDDGENTQQEIRAAWKDLFQTYSAILGEEESRLLTALIREAGNKLEK